jgi:hypothetical protein
MSFPAKMKISNKKLSKKAKACQIFFNETNADHVQIFVETEKLKSIFCFGEKFPDYHFQSDSRFKVINFRFNNRLHERNF